MDAGSAKGEERCEEGVVGRLSLSRAQSHQGPECEVREEQAYALFWTCHCSYSALLVDWISPVWFGFLDLQEWKFVVLEQKVQNFHEIACSLDLTVKHPSHSPEIEMLYAEVVWVAVDLGHHRP